MQFEDVKPYIGTRVTVDSREDLFDSANVAKCRDLLDHRTVLVFPELGLDDAEQLRFTDLLGSRVNLTNKHSNPDDTDVYQVTLDRKVNRQPEYVLGTFFWHMDGITVDMPPPKATLLSARTISNDGGQTEFASTYAAYEHLPDDDKALVKDLRARHSVFASLRPIHDAIPEADRDRVTGIGLVKDHPMVWTHDSGRKSLVIGTTADTVVDMPIPHGRALLARLLEWAAQPDFTYRHHWKPGDFVVWDNTGALHRVIPYDAESGRMMHRTSIAGTESVN